MLAASLAACTAAPPPAASSHSSDPAALAATPLHDPPRDPGEVTLAPLAELSRAVARQPGTSKLRGLKPTELIALLGEPDFRRAEPPAELWQYRTPDCIADIFLYREADGFRVVHTETRGRGLPGLGAGRCLDEAVQLRSLTRQSRL